MDVTGQLSANGVVLSSDRNLKANFTSVEAREILTKVASLPIQRWNFKSDGPNIRHLGPTAQDFRATFQLGSDEKRIDIIDEGGVALAAIKGLHEILMEKNAKISDPEKRNATLEARLAAIEKVLGIVETKGTPEK